jgi:hydrogenase maturation protease
MQGTTEEAPETAASTLTTRLADADIRARVLVLGLGNDILTDDAIGLNVTRGVAGALAGDGRVDVRETMEMGLALLDFIVGYDALVLVDSIQTGKAAPGHAHEVGEDALKLLPGPTPHFLGLGETIALGRRLGLKMPEQARIFAIEVEDPFTLGTRMTPALQRVVPALVDRVATAARELAAAVAWSG